jgi:hypothetical protein
VARDLDADIGRLIDGDLNREERLALLTQLIQDPCAIERLAVAVRLVRDLEALGRRYDEAEPNPGFVSNIFTALDREIGKPRPAGTPSESTPAACRLVQPVEAANEGDPSEGDDDDAAPRP